MEVSKIKERYQAMKHQGPTRPLSRCNSTDLIPQQIPSWVRSMCLIIIIFLLSFSSHSINSHNHICPKAPDALFDSRTGFFNGNDDETFRPLSARTTTSTLTRQLSNLSLNQIPMSAVSWTRWSIFQCSISFFSEHRMTMDIYTFVIDKWIFRV